MSLRASLNTFFGVGAFLGASFSGAAFFLAAFFGAFFSGVPVSTTSSSLDSSAAEVAADCGRANDRVVCLFALGAEVAVGLVLESARGLLAPVFGGMAGDAKCGLMMLILILTNNNGMEWNGMEIALQCKICERGRDLVKWTVLVAKPCLAILLIRVKSYKSSQVNSSQSNPSEPSQAELSPVKRSPSKTSQLTAANQITKQARIAPLCCERQCYPA